MKWFVGLAVFLLIVCKAPALADDGRGFNLYKTDCVLEGPVHIVVTTGDWMEGYVGKTPVGFAYYQDFVYGRVGEWDADLHLTFYYRQGWRLEGTVGPHKVRWDASYDRNFIGGFQTCLK